MYWGYILRICRVNGKEKGNYYIVYYIVYWDYILEAYRDNGKGNYYMVYYISLDPNSSGCLIS